MRPWSRAARTPEAGVHAKTTDTADTTAATGAGDTSGGEGGVEVPVVLPHAVFTVREDDTMTVTLDGTGFKPEPFAPPWRRASFAGIIDTLTDQRRIPIRVEVREVDGSVFTDIITPARHRAPQPEPAPAAGTEPALRLLALHGDGFVPGEGVTVAVIVAHAEAGPDGTTRGLLTPDELAHGPSGEVALIGRVSGTVAIGQPE